MTSHRTTAEPQPPHRSLRRQGAAVAGGLLLVQAVAALLVLWTTPTPLPHGVRVAVVSTDLAAGRLAADRLLSSAGGVLAPFVVPDVAEARRALQHRTADAAFLSGPKTTDELIVASAAGPGQRALLVARFQAYEKGRQRTIQLAEAAPLPSADRHGTAPQHLTLVMLLGGSLGAALFAGSLRSTRGPVRAAGQELALHAAYAVASATVVVLSTRVASGAFRGHEVQAVAGATLVCLTAARVFAAAQALAGRVAAGLLVLGLVTLSNLAAGAVVPYAFQPAPLRLAGPYLLGGAGTDLLRDLAYFHGHAIGAPLLVLATWLAAGCLHLAPVPVRAAVRPRAVPVGSTAW